MRLFIAIDLPQEVKDYLFNVQKEFKQAKVAWVSKKNLHITLKFLGDVEEDKVEQVREAINVSSKKITVSLGNLGFFPSESTPQVIWVSVEPEDEVVQLQQKIDGELLSLFPSEQKFRSHITIGRIKSLRRSKDFFESVKKIKIEKIEFTIDSFKLVKSELTKKGPMYEVLENVKLS
jgi:RNA 2',3'-cyclic 3'-phosphodiesterase